jgi:thiol-disulfide isomerase/thioredoxin
VNLRTTLSATTCLIAGLVLASCGTEPPAAPSASAPTTAAKSSLVACPPTPSRPPVTNSLPDVSLTCLGDGPDIRLADLRGPLVLNVWAQWCGPCRDEAPYLAKLAKTGKVRMLGIDYDDPRRELAVKFATDQGWTYPHLVDPDKTIQQALKVGGPPLTAFVDANGAVVAIHRGALTSQAQLDQLVTDKLGVAL